MTRKRDRTFAAFGAILFLVTSSALTIAVIWSLIQQSHQNKTSQVQSASTNKMNNTPPKNKLAGTKLAGFTPVSSIPKLQEIDTKVGNGPEVKPGASITVDYTGAVAATGIIFQSSLDSGQPAPLSLKSVIAGWSQGIPGMKVGGTRRLLIPSALAYGSNPPQQSGIPANADLVFDVTLKSIN